MRLDARLQRLEKWTLNGEGWEPWEEPNAEEMLAALCQLLGVTTEPPRDAWEATARMGKSASVFDWLAHEAGLTASELRGRLDAEAAEYKATHEWRWFGGRCWVRERQGP